MVKNKLAASADANRNPVSIQSTIRSGNGTRKTRKNIGKAAVAIHFLPIKRKPPLHNRQTNERVKRAVRAFVLKELAEPIFARKIRLAIAMRNGRAANPSARS